MELTVSIKDYIETLKEISELDLTPEQFMAVSKIIINKMAIVEKPSNEAVLSPQVVAELKKRNIALSELNGRKLSSALLIAGITANAIKA